jgi:hypothetical protein
MIQHIALESHDHFACQFTTDPAGADLDNITQIGLEKPPIWSFSPGGIVSSRRLEPCRQAVAETDDKWSPTHISTARILPVPLVTNKPQIKHVFRAERL